MFDGARNVEKTSKVSVKVEFCFLIARRHIVVVDDVLHFSKASSVSVEVCPSVFQLRKPFIRG